MYIQDGNLKHWFALSLVSPYLKKQEVHKKVALSQSDTEIFHQEAVCLYYVIQNYKNSEIADAMGVSKKVVESIISTYKEKYCAISKPDLISTLVKDTLLHKIIMDSMT